MSDNKFYFVQLPVFGQFGIGTTLNRNIHPPEVTDLHCLLDVLPTSDIFEIFPSIIATEILCMAFCSSGCSGFIVNDGRFETSDIFRDLHPDARLAKLRWLQITGIHHKDDFGYVEQTKLILSEKAKRIIESHKHEGVEFASGSQVPTSAEITRCLFEDAARTVEEMRKRRSQ